MRYDIYIYIQYIYIYICHYAAKSQNAILFFQEIKSFNCTPNCFRCFKYAIATDDAYYHASYLVVLFLFLFLFLTHLS